MGKASYPNWPPALSPGQPTWAKGRDTEPRPGIETHPDKTQEEQKMTKTKKQMPMIDLTQAGLTEQEMAWATGIINSRTGELRATKPPVTRTDLGPDPADAIGYYRIWGIEGGETAYIWRMVAFTCSPHSRHHCMPCMAEFDVPGKCGPEKRARIEQLDAIADKIADTIPFENWHGVTRWSRALGTPYRG